MLCSDVEFWRAGPAVLTRHHCRCCGWVVCLGCLPEGQTMELDRWVSAAGLKHGAPTAGQQMFHHDGEHFSPPPPEEEGE